MIDKYLRVDLSRFMRLLVLLPLAASTLSKWKARPSLVKKFMRRAVQKTASARNLNA